MERELRGEGSPADRRRGEMTRLARRRIAPGLLAYEGKEAVGWIAEAGRELGHTNPRIRLDDGKVVYGCECWWATEAKVRAMVAEHEARGVPIVAVDIDAARARYRAQEAERAGVDGEAAALDRETAVQESDTGQP